MSGTGVHDADLPVCVKLLNDFAIVGESGAPPLRSASQRVVALLAMHDRPLSRSFIAGTLWPDATQRTAGGALRSALWRIRRATRRLLVADNDRVGLDSAVSVDVREATHVARQLCDPAGEVSAAPEAIRLLDADILPEWSEDWLIVERERFRQLRLLALERACVALAEAGRYAQAVEAGFAAVAADPLRESSHEALIIAHLSRGNRAEAVRQYRTCERTLRHALALRPSAHVSRLVEGLSADIG